MYLNKISILIILLLLILLNIIIYYIINKKNNNINENFIDDNNIYLDETSSPNEKNSQNYAKCAFASST